MTGTITKPSNSSVVKSRKKPVLTNTIKFNKQVLKDINQLAEISYLVD